MFNTFETRLTDALVLIDYLDYLDYGASKNIFKASATRSAIPNQQQGTNEKRASLLSQVWIICKMPATLPALILLDHQCRTTKVQCSDLEILYQLCSVTRAQKGSFLTKTNFQNQP